MSQAFGRFFLYAFVALLVLSTSACGQDRFVYSMVAKITGGSDIDHVAVRFVEISFYWEWGSLGEGGFARYSGIDPRPVLKSLMLYWEKDGEQFERSFEIEMPPPDMVERIRTSGVEVNGHIDHSALELMFEIDPDKNTARVYWHERKFPPLSPPKN